MSDDSDHLPRDPSRDAAVRGALSARGVQWNCAACGSKDVILDEASGLTPLLPYTTRTPLGGTIDAVLPLYCLVCQNCGHVRLFGRDIVDQIGAGK